MKKKTLNKEAAIAAAFIGAILLLVIPLPPLILDLLICLSFAFSLMALSSVLFVKEPLDFSSFPSLLLFLTLYRLALNVASTRLILAEGEAGKIIHTFGSFVIKNNATVGLILFLLLVLVNFIVITKGAGRIAEVSARFILEALPGKQLAIDSDLERKVLSIPQGKKARAKLASEADFYGAMDGASKFIRGDAIASLIITFVNIIGGILIGFFSRGLSIHECWSTYACLTIGDGIVTQIPALLISVSAGLMLTSSSSLSVGEALAKQMWMSSKTLLLTGTTLFLLSFIPGMPFWVISSIALCLCAAGIKRKKNLKEKDEIVEGPEEEMVSFIIPPIEISLGKYLVKEAEKLTRECQSVRMKLASTLGTILPLEQMREEKRLRSSDYQIKIKGGVVCLGEGRANFASDFEKVTRNHAHLLLHRQETARLIETARMYDAVVIDELIPKKLVIGDILKVLQNLLREKISIRDFISILEVLADNVKENEKPDLDLLTEVVRQKLSRAILATTFEGKKEILVITLDPKIEAMISAAIVSKKNSVSLLLLPKMAEKLTESLKNLVEKQGGEQPIILTTASSRRHLRRLIEKRLPDTPVFSYKEIESDYRLRSAGVLSSDVLNCL